MATSEHNTVPQNWSVANMTTLRDTLNPERQLSPTAQNVVENIDAYFLGDSGLSTLLNVQEPANMLGFAQDGALVVVLDTKQIQAIVEYAHEELDHTTYTHEMPTPIRDMWRYILKEMRAFRQPARIRLMLVEHDLQQPVGIHKPFMVPVHWLTGIASATSNPTTILIDTTHIKKSRIILNTTCIRHNMFLHVGNPTFPIQFSN